MRRGHRREAVQLQNQPNTRSNLFRLTKLHIPCKLWNSKGSRGVHGEGGGVFINVGLPFSPIIRVFVGRNSRRAEFYQGIKFSSSQGMGVSYNSRILQLALVCEHFSKDSDSANAPNKSNKTFNSIFCL